jgi:ABC-type methionine transport system ATPase subunit
VTPLKLEKVGQAGGTGRDETRALENVSLSIEKGDFIGIQGERRSGKSALLRIIAGWERPDMGRVIFGETDIWELSDGGRARLRRAGGIGLAAGWSRPSTNKAAIRHVQEALASAGFSLREAAAPAIAALERVGLIDSAYRPSNMLTQGELIRLGLAQRLVHSPSVLLVDEPAVLLRPTEAAELYDLLGELGRDPDLALVLASEELTPIRMTRQVFTLDGGRLRSMARPSGRVLDFPARRPAATGQ